MVVEVYGAISGIKTAIDLAKSLKDIGDAVALNEVKLSLLGELVSVYEAQLAQQERYRDLEAEVMRLRAWESEKDRYQLVQIIRGSFAYVLKASERAAEPAHCLCADCYAAGKKSFLQVVTADSMGTKFQCGRCQTSFTHNYWREGPPANYLDGIDTSDP